MEKLLLLFVQKYSRPSFLISCIHIPYYVTLAAQVFRWQKKYPLLILRSRPSRDSQEPKTKKKSILTRAFLENLLFVLFPALILDLVDPGTCFGYFFLLTFSYCFKRILLAKKVQIACMGSKVPFWKNCQNGTFEPVHKI